MAKTTAPLLGFSASGQIGKAVVHAKWKGVTYARAHVVPANPKTTAQLAQRAMFTNLSYMYKVAPALFTESWLLAAKGQPQTDRNMFIGKNRKALFGKANMQLFVFSSAVGGGLPTGAVTPTPGSGSISLAIVAPALPTGWTITEAIAAAFKDQAPTTAATIQLVAGDDTTSTYAVVLSGLTSSALYTYGAWFKYAKPDGSVAYGPATNGTSTPS